MDLITVKADLIKAIDSIAKRSKTLDRDIHVAACSSLSHLSQHGDIGMVNRLYNALGKGTRKSAMSSWLLAYGSLIANDDKATKGLAPFKFTKEKTTALEAGIKDPWFDHAPDKAPDEIFDLAKAIEGIIKKAQGKELVHGEVLAKLESIVAAVHAQEVGVDEEEEATTE